MPLQSAVRITHQLRTACPPKSGCRRLMPCCSQDLLVTLNRTLLLKPTCSEQQELESWFRDKLQMVSNNTQYWQPQHIAVPNYLGRRLCCRFAWMAFFLLHIYRKYFQLTLTFNTLTDFWVYRWWNRLQIRFCDIPCSFYVSADAFQANCGTYTGVLSSRFPRNLCCHVQTPEILCRNAVKFFRYMCFHSRAVLFTHFEKIKVFMDYIYTFEPKFRGKGICLGYICFWSWGVIHWALMKVTIIPWKAPPLVIVLIIIVEMLKYGITKICLSHCHPKDVLKNTLHMSLLSAGKSMLIECMLVLNEMPWIRLEMTNLIIFWK